MAMIRTLLRKIRRPPRDANAAAPRLRQGESDAARLRRLGESCVTGNLAGAELELHEWSRHSDCPPQALTLLASLLARRGRADLALDVLHRHARPRTGGDPALTTLHTALLIRADLPEAARRAALHLHQEHGHDPTIESWLTATDSAGSRPLPAIPQTLVDRLRSDLVKQPQVIPSLVAAAKIQRQPLRVMLLRLALQQAMKQFEDPRVLAGLCQALGELALIAGDRDEARRWAYRGLRLSPMSAALALLLAEVGEDPAVGPPVVTVLERAAQANPTYPDLRAALIRNEFARGRSAHALARLRDWLERDPGNATAQSLQRELAA